MTRFESRRRLTCGPIELDVKGRTLHLHNERHHLTPKECRLLEVFLLHQGQVLTRQFLMKEVWLTDYVADTRTLEVHVHWLRRKIEDSRASARCIHTVRGVGYVLRPVEPVEPDEGETEEEVTRDAGPGREPEVDVAGSKADP